ncbi:MAG: hypothetical protein C4K48_05555 [Candidatus Thorarchaeota archaeon]|nr:MAG: hypothetical protein C4K48_05555 [Candidatus Thorarchaeota archaeon]
MTICILTQSSVDSAIMKTFKPSLRLLLVTVLIMIILGSSVLVVTFLSPRPLAGVKVAVYDDNGTTPASQIALESMFRWMGADVTVIGDEDVETGALSSYDVFVAPGGCWCDERCDILDDYEIVRQFILDGGSYFGVDGGASYATSYRLGLFQGTLWPDTNGTGDWLLEMNVNRESTGPDLSDEPESYTIFYESSGHFDAGNMTGTIPICTYTDTGLPSMIAFKYGNGTVFLSSPHPEYEEGNMNDGTDLWDTYSDPDSEWGLMLKICEWLLEESHP